MKELSPFSFSWLNVIVFNSIAKQAWSIWCVHSLALLGWPGQVGCCQHPRRAHHQAGATGRYGTEEGLILFVPGESGKARVKVMFELGLEG